MTVLIRNFKTIWFPRHWKSLQLLRWYSGRHSRPQSLLLGSGNEAAEPWQSGVDRAKCQPHLRWEQGQGSRPAWGSPFPCSWCLKTDQWFPADLWLSPPFPVLHGLIVSIHRAHLPCLPISHPILSFHVHLCPIYTEGWTELSLSAREAPITNLPSPPIPFLSPLPPPAPSISLPPSLCLSHSVTVSFCLRTLASLWTLEVSTSCWIKDFCPELILSLRCGQWNSFHSCMVPIKK